MAQRRSPAAAAAAAGAPRPARGPPTAAEGGGGGGAEPVEVLFVHGTRPGEELRLKLSPDLTMGQVKLQLVRAVGREIGRVNVRLASRDGNTFSYYEDKQLLGKAREVVVLGLTLSGAAPNEATQNRMAALGYATVPVTVSVDGSEATVSLIVQETATLTQLKDLLARQLQRPEILKEGYFVPLENEDLRLPENEPLRGRWQLRLRGLEAQASPQPGAALFQQPVDRHAQQSAVASPMRKEEHEALLALFPGLAAAPRRLPVQPAGRGTAGPSAAAASGPPAHASFCRCLQCQYKPSPVQRGPLEMLAEYLPEGEIEWPLGAGGSPLVTALIATHRGRLSALRDAVASALGQTYQPIEIVVVVQNVPGEADAAHLQAVRSEAFARLPVVRVVSATEQPAGLAWVDEWGIGDRHADEHKAHRAAFVRNAGLAAARGDYVAFLDDDDVWLPGKLTTMIEEMRRTGSAIAASDAYCGPLSWLRPFWPQKHSEGIKDGRFELHNRDKHRNMLQQRVKDFNPEVQCGVTEDMLRRHNLLITSTMVLSKELLGKLGYMNTEVLWEDYDFWVRAIELEFEVLYIPAALTVYDEEHGASSRSTARGAVR